MITIQKMIRVMLIVSLAALFGCGGGGGGSSSTTTAPAVPAKATTTVSGKVNFPTLSSLVAKQVYAVGDTINVQAYTIDGVAVGKSVVAQANGDFSIPDLNAGVDYVLKATRGTQVLKKLIEKATITGVDVSGQNISDVSTTAVVVASQKLGTTINNSSFSLGESVNLTAAEKANLSTGIFATVSPKDLESAISTAKTTIIAAIGNSTLSSVTNLDLVNLVNTLNLIVAAVSNNIDMTQVSSGQLKTFTAPARLIPLEVTGGTITQGAPIVGNVSSDTVKQTASSVTYTPPARTQLEIKTDATAGSLYGITFDIIIPAGATVKLDGQGKPDLSAMSLAPGVTLSCQLIANMSGNVLRVMIADVSPLPTGRLVSIVFDGKPSAGLFFVPTIIKTSDVNGASTTVTLAQSVI